MICYKDRTYCSSENCMGACGRKITDEDHKKAAELRLPVAFAPFCDKEGKYLYEQASAD